MSMLKEKLASQIPNLQEKVRNLAKVNGKKSVSQVTVEQVLGGMRGVKSLICDTSEVALDKGLIIDILNSSSYSFLPTILSFDSLLFVPVSEKYLHT